MPPPSSPVAECPELQYTLERTRLTGKKDNSYCWNAGVGRLPFSTELKAICENLYVDPLSSYVDGYEPDCSLGCAPCVYELVPNDAVNYRCTSGPILTGCPN
jgi:hypothetical protein